MNKYVAIQPFTYDREYQPGETLNLPESTAAELISLGAIELNRQTEKQSSKPTRIDPPTT